MATTVTDARAKKKKYDSWEVDNAAGDLIRAEEIRQDPVLYPLAKKALKKKVAAAKKATLIAKVTVGLHKAMPGGD